MQNSEKTLLSELAGCKIKKINVDALDDMDEITLEVDCDKIKKEVTIQGEVWSIDSHIISIHNIPIKKIR